MTSSLSSPTDLSLQEDEADVLLLETLRGLRIHALTASPVQLALDVSLGRLLLARMRAPALRQEAEGFLKAMGVMQARRRPPSPVRS
ncbi:MAG: hypothetical protein VKO21_09775 [Candidatus Sericytochromatia bacterium]|nr:hypothetical protein [Candidatus Sericytochromatia bacterium]